jgi:hypothetical protein
VEVVLVVLLQMLLELLPLREHLAEVVLVLTAQSRELLPHILLVVEVQHIFLLAHRLQITVLVELQHHLELALVDKEQKQEMFQASLDQQVALE